MVKYFRVSTDCVAPRCSTSYVNSTIQNRPKSDTIPSNVLKRLRQLANRQLDLKHTSRQEQKPASVGVYLGAFDDPLAAPQERLLQQWDLLIVDPLQQGVVEAVRHGRCQVLGRVDLAHLISPKDSAVLAIEKIEGFLSTNFNGSAYSGILFANWETLFSPTLHAKLCEAISSLGLVIYLETQPPHFLSNRKPLQNNAVSGLVICNASILPNGEKRDYFQMTEMQATIKAFVSEACMRAFVVVAWETIDNDVTLSNATVQRSFKWYNFYSVISWIGSEAALYDANLNMPTKEPLPAFGWLKEANVMKSHDVWRSNSAVLQSFDQNAAWETLRQSFPSVTALLESTEHETRSEATSISCLRDPPEWISQIKSQGNPLSVSMSGHEYDYLGCFPLGSDSNPVAFAEILHSQQRLKELSLLHPVHLRKSKTFQYFYASIKNSSGFQVLMGSLCLRFRNSPIWLLMVR